MKSINQNAPVKCSKNILINAGKERVWSVLTHINRWKNWQSDISASVLDEPLLPGATFRWKTGGAKITSKLHTVDLYEQFGWTGKTFGMTAIHNWTLTEINGKTRVDVTESMEGLLATLLKSSFNKNLESGMQHWLELLKRECELQNATL